MQSEGFTGTAENVILLGIIAQISRFFYVSRTRSLTKMDFKLDYQQIAIAAIVALVVVIIYNVAKSKISQLP